MGLRIFLSVVAAICFAIVPFAAEGFAHRDGDKVVFLEDSFTAGCGYSRMIEQYTLLSICLNAV